MKSALVSLAIGDKYLIEYSRNFRPSHEVYAKKCGYDFKLVTDYLDQSFRVKDAITFNKLLACSQPWSKEYDYIIVVDADILINPNSPPIHLAYSYGDKIGMVDEFSQPTTAMHIEIQKINSFEETATEYYQLHAQKRLVTDSVLNTGLMVLQPSKHRCLLEDIYNKYVRLSVGNKSGYHFEQASVGYEIQTTDAYLIMDNKWNAIWCQQSIIGNISLEAYVNNNYFTHFVGGMFHEYVPHLRFTV